MCGVIWFGRASPPSLLIIPPMDDTIDILGSPHRSLSLWQSLPILIRSTLYTSGLIALYFGSIRAWAFLKIHREVNYRRAMRRKHGIPDDDRRPFNVAYAAVVRERQQPEWYRILGETLARLPIAPPPPPAIESLGMHLFRLVPSDQRV